MHRDVLRLTAERRGLLEFTDRVRDVVRASGIATGLCHLFVQHTSASLTVQENADPTARADLEAFFDRLVPRDTPYFRHTSEGPDDMPSHIRSVLSDTSMLLPVENGELALGTWQGVYLFEHRDSTPSRRVLVTVF